MRSITLVAFACVQCAAMAQITVDPMMSVSFCGGPTVGIPFTAAGSYNAGNVFTMELSDASGSFASPTVIGSFAGTGSGSISSALPAGIVGNSGWAIRVVASDPAEVGDAYALPITTVVPPNAGTSATATVCSNDAPFSMIQLLGGNPVAGGAWVAPPGMQVSNMFNPATSVAGCYQYFVSANPPCANASASLCISVNPGPPALGPDFTIGVCNGLPVDMQAGLPPGGTWTYIGAPHAPIYVPGTDSPGPYVYSIPGAPPCNGSSVMATVLEGTVPNAGANASLSWCASFGALDLFAQVNGSPDAGGTWSDINATGGLNGSSFDPAGIPAGTYTFFYTVNSAVCGMATATVTVSLGACLVGPQLETE